MSDLDDTAESMRTNEPLPEFRIVVRRPDRRGPLAPYRLLVSVGVVMLVFGSTLYRSVVDGMPDDGVLLRAAAVGLLVWITTGIVSSALGAAEQQPRPRPPTDSR